MLLAACSFSGGGRPEKGFLKLFSFFKSPLRCETAFPPEKFAPKANQIIQQAELCLKEKKQRRAGLLLEAGLKALKRRDSSVLEIKRLERRAGDVFYKLKSYEKALKRYTGLISDPFPLQPGEKFFIQYRIAESYFHLKKYSQALREAEKCFLSGASLSDEKQASLLKGRIFIAQRRFEPAILFFKRQIEKFPEEEAFFREYLAFIYEAKKDFLSAAQELEKIKPPRAFLSKKIDRLLKRQNNQPGF